MKARRWQIAAAAVICAVLANSTARAATECGGTGGNRTTTFECPAGAFLVGMGAVGQVYVDSLRFRCSSGKESSTIGKSGVSTASNVRSGAGGCTGSNLATSGFMTAIDTKCGWYVDRINYFRCGQQTTTINVGGDGGERRSLACPSGQAIYKVQVRYGGWVDRLKIFCRAP